MKFLIISFFFACASAQWVAPYSNWSPYNPQFYNDLYSKSVDLNKDGQPDAPVYTAAAAVLPNYYPYAGLNYRGAFPYTYGAPFTYPFVQAAAEVKPTRSKRQVPAVLPHKPSEFLNDFAYRSVDLNQDGQPDNTFYTTPVAPLTGAQFVTPYTGYTGYYPQAYPLFIDGFFGTGFEASSAGFTRSYSQVLSRSLTEAETRASSETEAKSLFKAAAKALLKAEKKTLSEASARSADEAKIGASLEAEAKSLLKAAAKALLKAEGKTLSEASARSADEAEIGISPEAEAKSLLKAAAKALLKAEEKTLSEASARSADETEIGASLEPEAKSLLKAAAKALLKAEAKATSK